MIERNKFMKRDIDASRVLKEISEDKYNPQDIDAERAVMYLLDDDRYLVYRYEDGNRNGLIKRFNCIWFYPLFILTVPFQWLLLGKVGVKRESKIGKIIETIIGFD